MKYLKKAIFSKIRLINDVTIHSKSITFKYFEPGHTFMSADSVHGNIGTAIRAEQNIYDMRDFIETIAHSRKDLEVLKAGQITKIK